MNKAYAVLNLKSVDQEKRIILGTATTPSPDRVGDIIQPLGVEFKNPMPLLWQHDTKQPVGTVKFSKPTKEGIEFTAQMPKVVKSVTLQNRIDEAWESVQLGLVRAVSIGFRPKKYSFMDDGGMDFQETEVMELSLVTIPANAEATIHEIKKYDVSSRDNSQHTKDVSLVPDKSGGTTNITVKSETSQPAAGKEAKASGIAKTTSNRKAGTKMPKTVAEQISAFENTRAAQVARMKELMDAVSEKGETLSDEDAEEHDTAEESVKKIDEHLVRLRKQLDLVKATAQQAQNAEEQEVVTDETQKQKRDTIVRATGLKANVPGGTAFARYAQALLYGKGNRWEAINFAKNNIKNGLWGNTPEIETFLEADIPAMAKAAVGTGTTTDATWASPLVAYNVMQSEFIELLRPATILGRIPGLRRVPFNIQMPRTTSGSTAGWVGENAPKPVSAMAFDTVTLRWAKAAGIVVMTDELVRFSNPSAEAVVRQDLVDTIAQFLDRQFVDPSVAEVTNVSPASITNGVTGVTPTGTSMQTFRADLKTLFANLSALNIPTAGGVFIMTEDQALSLSIAQNSLGQSVFPTINSQGGTLLGYPVITSQNLPSSTGSPVEGYPIIFLIAKEIMLADDGQVILDASNQASVQMDGAPDSPPSASTNMVSLWQMNMTGIRAERWINWKKRRTGVVQFISSAKYSE